MANGGIWYLAFSLAGVRYIQACKMDILIVYFSNQIKLQFIYSLC